MTTSRTTKAADEKAADRADEKAADRADVKDVEMPDTELVTDADGDTLTVDADPEGAIYEPIVVPQETSEDRHGIRRVVGGFDDGWEPAPLQQPDEIIKRNEARMAAIEKARKDREDILDGKKTQAVKDAEAEAAKDAEAKDKKDKS